VAPATPEVDHLDRRIRRERTRPIPTSFARLLPHRDAEKAVGAALAESSGASTANEENRRSGGGETIESTEQNEPAEADRQEDGAD